MKAISVEGVGKRYMIAHQSELQADYKTLRETIMSAGRNLVRGRLRERVKREPYWAIRDISFDLEPGEVLGVIGRNGAGKSTLLKVLSRITPPTEGRFRLWGRVGSLLEVGAGFHPELTGRENIFLVATLLGMTAHEARTRFDRIVEFAEIERFLDTPVKRYSSGMYVRLAFSVAAHLEPEILIVDEVLAVGDAAFQERCLGKMREVAAQDGRTVVFVSHNIASIAGLCTKGLVLEKGRTRYLGPVRAAVDDYMSDATSGRFESEPDSRACIRAAEIDATALAVGDLRIHVEVESPKVIRPSVGVVVSSYSGGTLFGTDAKTHPMEAGVARCKRTRMTLEVPKLPLHSGRYIVSLFLTDLDMGPVEHQRDALSFEFVSPVFIPNLPRPEMIGPLLLPARWSQEVGEA